MPRGEIKKFILEGAKADIKDDKNLSIKKPIKKNILKTLHNILLPDNGNSVQLEFKALSDVSAHSSSHMPSRPPELKLGAVLKKKDGSYYICIQAICDSSPVGNTHRFLFIEVYSEAESNNQDQPDHVIPLWPEGKKDFLKLFYKKQNYQHLLVEEFSADGDSSYIQAKKSSNGKWYFTSTANKYKKWEWLASLKQRRANRIAEQVAKKIARVGFDEFEPFRNKND